jgi:AraC-like DNA-binding protein
MPDGSCRVLEPHTLFLRNPEIPHTTRFFAGDPFLELFFVFDKATSFLLTESVMLGDRPLVLSLQSEPWVLARLVSVVRRMNLPEYEAPTFSLLVEVLQTVENAYLTVDTGPVDPWEAVVSQAARDMEDHPSARVNLPEMATRLGSSYTAFRRAFKALRGISPGRYQIQCRIQKACRLLRDHSIPEVAEILQYADQFTFSRQFKQYVGLAPKHFQEKLLHRREF